MNSFLLLPLAFLPISFDHSFAVRADLRGLYDEMSQASIQIGTGADIDDFHEVLCTSDWVFIDMDGRRHDWREMREGVIRLEQEQALDSMEQTIQQLVLVPGGATVIVKVTAVRNVPADPTAFDDRAQSAQWHDTQQLTETTFFRDSWVETRDAWKLKSREQLTPAKASAGSSAVGFGSSMTRPARLSSTSSSHPASSSAGLMARLCARSDALTRAGLSAT